MSLPEEYRSTTAEMAASDGEDTEVDVRETLRVLPKWLNPLIDWGTGKTLSDAQPPKWMQSEKWRAIAPHYFFYSKLIGFSSAVLGNAAIVFEIAHGASLGWAF